MEGVAVWEGGKGGYGLKEVERCMLRGATSHAWGKMEEGEESTRFQASNTIRTQG